MSTTREIVNRLMQKHKGWNADGPRGVLPHLNIAHNILMSGYGDRTVYVDETNGRLPYFSTTQGTYTYTFSTIRELKYVLVEVGVNGSVLDTITGTDYGMRSSATQPIDYIHWAGIDYMRIRYVRSWPTTSAGGDCRIAFSVDPGTTSDVYQYLGYTGPTELTAVTVAHDIPAPLDEIYLVPAADLLISAVENGNHIQAMEYIKDTILPAFQDAMGTGEQGFSFMAEDRGF